jgi:membrane-associated phospholipid phosphatase
MMDALLRSRDATADVYDTARSCPPLPAIDGAAAMARWEGWVRAFVAVQELVSPLTFTRVSDGAAIPADIGMLLSYGTGGVLQPVAGIIRPPASCFEQQLALVLDWAELREERSTEILAQIDPQYAFWASILGLRSDRHRHTLELINLTLQLCVFVEMRFKHALACWRPVDLSAQVQPIITTPGHGSLPSGHATQAYAVAQVLSSLRGFTAGSPRHEQLQRLSARIATNRVIAGVHFPVDSLAGRLLGQALGEYVVARCAASGGQWLPRGFDGRALADWSGTDLQPMLQPLDSGSPPFYQSLDSPASCLPTPLLSQWVWQQAHGEWS